MKVYYILLFLFLVCCLSPKANAQKTTHGITAEVKDLSGTWNFQIDSLNKGIKEKWYVKQLKDHLTLPGSMTTNGKGDDITLKTPWTGDIIDSGYFFKPVYEKYRHPGHIKVPFWLQPKKYYKGPAWYQQTVEIPASWAGKHLELELERVHWQSMVWIDGKQAGAHNSLGTAHLYDLDHLLTPGKHRITVRVDNAVHEINVGPNSHSISDHTQTNWNGIIGHIQLVAKPQIYIANLQLYPDVAKKQVVADLEIVNNTGKPAQADVQLLAISNRKSGGTKSLSKSLSIPKKENRVQIIYPMGEKPLLWSEFDPNFYRMHVSLSAKPGSTDQVVSTFGMRNFSTEGTNFMINGRPTILRGSLECAAFPETGYPPTDVAYWMKELNTCKSYGLNHLRFHSWCPPEAAFLAADSLGFYLQIECSSWANQGATVGDGTPLDKYIYDESNAIVKAYGNHPSFCMLAYGNEPAGKNLVKYLTDFVTYWKKKDPRRLYTTGAGWPIVSESNYNSTPDPRIQHWGAGLKSIINSQPPKADYDWSDVIAKWQHPTVSHEIGQWCVYPDFKEIKRYKGVLKANNFEIFQDQLAANGLSSCAEDFLYCSGKLQALCYKADIEAALRTKGFGGFQLLGLSDFPGQGTALVGVLNAFWEKKSYIDGAEFSEFCNRVVPLARFPKMVYLNNEQLNIPVEVAQFGAEPLQSITPEWVIKNDKGLVLYSGKLEKQDIGFGNGIKIGQIVQNLSAIEKPSRLNLSISIGRYKNNWDFFVYPAQLPTVSENIVVTQRLDENALTTLQNGGKVLLTLKKGSVPAKLGGNIAIGFSSIFWNTAWTNGQPPVTLGILCDPGNPAFGSFPTQKYSNWQWWDAMSHSSPLMIDSLSKELKPIVRVIDDWVTARSLGLVVECKVGKGRLIISGIDLLTDAEKRPEARQLLYSLKSYMAQNEFDPKVSLDLNKVRSLYQ